MLRPQLFASAICALLAAGCSASGNPDLPPSAPPPASSETLSPFLPETEMPSALADSEPSPAETETAAPLPAPTETPMPIPSFGTLTITILYNNVPSDPRLKTDWGFSALVERGEEILLFDTGGNGAILMGNMDLLGADPAGVRHVVISHAHSDHTGGLTAFLDAASQPPVYLLAEFGAAFLTSVRQRTEVIEAAPGMEIARGILTTGNVGGSIPEQSLVVRTQKGLVVITGCAHPGIVRIVERAVELTGEGVYLVLGGFHLKDMNDAQISSILRDFRRLGVQKVAPSHCTGDRAIAMFAAEYGEDFLRTGAGSVIRLEG
jgi:7,8-dihydropterin-6-yl-methyl-4-(beta-D-ribofuranosyl)aminobenzene 5'-phosphate synthase